MSRLVGEECGGRLSKLLRFPYISIASLVRQELSPRFSHYKKGHFHIFYRAVDISAVSNRVLPNSDDACSKPNHVISNALNRGLLVPEDVIFGLLSNTLFGGHYRGESDFIMNGLPQNRFQAGLLDEIAELDLVITFKCIDQFPVEIDDYYLKQKKLLSFQVTTGAPSETWQGLISALCLNR